MKRRTFILAFLNTLLLRVFYGCDFVRKNIFHSMRSKRTTNVVEQLRWINDIRRQKCAENSEGKTASALNEVIPEIDSIELFNHYASKPGSSLRLVAWNTERGRNWRDCVQFIKGHSYLNDPDIVFLGEMDLGMARSGNEHTTREMARALKMNYAYGVEFLELTNGEPEERKLYLGENDWGYHGNAILSKYPLINLRMIRFPGIESWYAHYQKRLGGRIALFADVSINGQIITLVSTHLENLGNDYPLRKRQTEMILAELKKQPHDTPIIIGGDLNAIPAEPLFTELKKEGFNIDNCNEMGIPTQQIMKKGQVCLEKNQIDYIIVKNFKVIRDVTSPKTVLATLPNRHRKQMLSDHAIVTVKISLDS